MIDRAEWIDVVTIEDMPNSDMRLVAESCGIDMAVKLLEELPGIGIFIPKFGMKKLVDKYISSKHNGSNAKEIAIRCGVSERYVYQLVRVDPLDEHQLKLL